MALKLPAIKESHGATILRALMGIIFITHGAARLYYGSVTDFGAFLDSQGLVIGEVIAWIITIGEIFSGGLLMVGILVRYLVLFHGIIIISGILMVHLPNGWFTVGHGQGGVEYSLLILAVLIYLYSREGGVK